METSTASRVHFYNCKTDLSGLLLRHEFTYKLRPTRNKSLKVQGKGELFHNLPLLSKAVLLDVQVNPSLALRQSNIQFEIESHYSKESTMALDTDAACTEATQPKTYPFALVLRLRVLQIVCGISSLVMGTVALIEEHGQVNLGLGMPAGIATVIAAGVSIHTSRGWSGYREPSCRPGLRFLGPTPGLGAASGCLWGTAVCLHSAVLGLALPSLSGGGSQMAAVAALLACLSAVTLLAVAAVLRLDCAYDPD